jgi:hypothetical protein
VAAIPVAPIPISSILVPVLLIVFVVLLGYHGYASSCSVYFVAEQQNYKYFCARQFVFMRCKPNRVD